MLVTFLITDISNHQFVFLGQKLHQDLDQVLLYLQCQSEPKELNHEEFTLSSARILYLFSVLMISSLTPL